MHATNLIDRASAPYSHSISLLFSLELLFCHTFTVPNEREKTIYAPCVRSPPRPPPTFLLLPRFFLFSLFFSLLLLAGFEHFHFHFLCTTSKSLSLHFGYQNARSNNGSRDFFRCRSAPFFRSGPRQIKNPIPFRSKFLTPNGPNTDFSMTSPLNPDGSNFHVRGIKTMIWHQPPLLLQAGVSLLSTFPLRFSCNSHSMVEHHKWSCMSTVTLV